MWIKHLGFALAKGVFVDTIISKTEEIRETISAHLRERLRIF